MPRRFKDDEQRFRDAILPLLVEGRNDFDLDALSAAAGINSRFGQRIYRQMLKEVKRLPVVILAVPPVAEVVVEPEPIAESEPVVILAVPPEQTDAVAIAEDLPVQSVEPVAALAETPIITGQPIESPVQPTLTPDAT